jgi:ABC-type lipoprotein release transport system permease subunit
LAGSSYHRGLDIKDEAETQMANASRGKERLRLAMTALGLIALGAVAAFLANRWLAASNMARSQRFAGAAVIGLAAAFGAVTLYALGRCAALLLTGQRFTFALATRYMRRRIIWISAALTCLVTAFFLVIISVMHGFRSYFEESLRQFSADVIITKPGQRHLDSEEADRRVRQTAKEQGVEIVDVTPFVEGFAAISGERFLHRVQIKGVKLDRESRAAGWETFLPPHVVAALQQGEYPWRLPPNIQDGKPVSPIQNPLILGKYLLQSDEGEEKDIFLGRMVTVTAVAFGGRPGRAADNASKNSDPYYMATPVGNFEQGNYLLNKHGVVTDFESAQIMFKLVDPDHEGYPTAEEKRRASGVSVWLKSSEQAASLQASLRRAEVKSQVGRARAALAALARLREAARNDPEAARLMSMLDTFEGRMAPLAGEAEMALEKNDTAGAVKKVWEMRWVEWHAADDAAEILRPRENLGPEAWAFRDALKKYRDNAPYKVETWYDTYPQYIQAITLQNRVIRFFGVCFLLMVAFFMAFMMWVIVKEKRRDIGILKAVGGGRRAVVGIFLLNGLFIGLAGTVTGLGLGWLMQKYVNPISKALGLDFLANVLMDMPEFKPLLAWPDVALIACVAIGSALLASLYPASVAAKIDAIETMRRE